MLSFPIRLALVADPVLHAIAAIIGPDVVTLGLSPITWFGIFIAIGIFFDEVGTTLVGAVGSRRRKQSMRSGLLRRFAPRNDD